MTARTSRPPRLLLAGLLVACAASATAPVHAQQEPQEEDRWGASVELGFNGATGNKTFAILRTGASLEHLRTDVAEFEWTAGYRYGESENEVVANELRTAFKVDLQPDATWSPFAFASALRDPIRRLDVRTSGGAGAKYSFVRSENEEISLSNALLFEYEDFDQGPGEEPVDSEWTLRWSLRFRVEEAVGERVGIKHTSFYQPVWDELGDYLLEITTSLSTPVLGRLDLVVEHEYLHDASPPPGVLRDDQRLSVLFRMAL